MDVWVVGLGGCGLALATQCALKGLSVVGTDADPEVLRQAALASRQRDEELAEMVERAMRSGHLRFAPYEPPGVPSVIFLELAAEIDRELRLSYDHFDRTLEMVAPALRAGALLVTTGPLGIGETRHRIGEPLRRRTGLGEDLLVAHSPVRRRGRQTLSDLKRFPRIVGALDAASLQRAATLFAQAFDTYVFPVRDSETAETSLLPEAGSMLLQRAAVLEFCGVLKRTDDLPSLAGALNGAWSPEPPLFAPLPEWLPLGVAYLFGRGEVPLVRAAWDGHSAIASGAVDRLEKTLDGLVAKPVVVARSPSTSPADPVARLECLLAERGARVSGWDPESRTGCPPTEAVVWCAPTPKAEVDPSYSHCRVLFDIAVALDRRALPESLTFLSLIP